MGNLHLETRFGYLLSRVYGQYHQNQKKRLAAEPRQLRRLPVAKEYKLRQRTDLVGTARFQSTVGRSGEEITYNLVERRQ
jgi:hypothetical protein